MSYSRLMLADHPVARYTADVAAVGVTAGSFLGYLPSIAAVLSILYMAVQIALAVQTYLERRELARGPRGHRGPKGPPGEDGKDLTHD